MVKESSNLEEEKKISFSDTEGGKITIEKSSRSDIAAIQYNE